MSTMNIETTIRRLAVLASRIDNASGDLHITVDVHLHRIPHDEMEGIIKELADDPDAATYHTREGSEWKRFKVGGLEVAAFYETYLNKQERLRNVHN